MLFYFILFYFILFYFILFLFTAAAVLLPYSTPFSFFVLYKVKG
jgi:hypothetical protein